MAHSKNETQPLQMTNIDINVSDDDDEDDNLTYEQQREKRIKDNFEMFKSLGFHQAADMFADSLKNMQHVNTSINSGILNNFKKASHTADMFADSLKNMQHVNTSINSEKFNNFKKASLYPRRSERLSKVSDIQIQKPAGKHNIVKHEEISILAKRAYITAPKRTIPFLERLSANIASQNDFHSCDLNKYTQVVKKLEMNEASIQVVNSRICSLAIHPLETSLIVAAGSLFGTIALYNKNDSTMIECQIHDQAVDCISFCTWNPNQLFSTSYDGTVRYGDIVQKTFNIIYKSNLWTNNKKTTNCTCHTEYDRNLLIGNGLGYVNLIDTRIPNKIQNTARCHNISVCTVQCHPLKNQYFVTSSKLGEVSLWDIRKICKTKIEPILKFEHPEALSSAFFSASGSNMVSTCNDDYIRIFNTTTLTKTDTEPVHKIYHDHHTVDSTTIFKAKWNPGRDDVYFIGGKSNPKEIQIYNSDGNLLHSLISENMTTCCPVIEVHPTQAIFVGGNENGHIHIFDKEKH